jgi:nucleotide-binding universal stress UspA family protein
MPQIVTIRTKDDSAGESIAVVLSQDAVCLGPDGQPWSGVSLKSEEARKLATRLLSLALEIDGQKQLEQRYSINSLTDLASILVFHDGSEQSHRAFRLALDFASRSLARIQMAGVFGMKTDQFEASSLPDDYEWQQGWLERLTASYSGQAAEEGIELRTTLVAANNHQAILDLFDSNRFDLIIVPYKFSDHNNERGTLKALMQTLADTKKSKVLFCP